jgi:hypothetical protein
MSIFPQRGSMFFDRFMVSYNDWLIFTSQLAGKVTAKNARET